MTPNIFKSQTDTSKFTGTKPPTSDNDPNNNNFQNYNPASGGGNTSAFRADGAVGKQFTTEGALGGTAQNIGGPLDKDGIIGKQFTETGALGNLGNKVADTTERK